MIDALIPPVDRALSLGRPPRHADAAAGRRGDRGGRERDRLHEHALADRDLVSGDSRRAARTGPARSRSITARSTEAARVGRGRAARRARCAASSRRRSLDLGVDFSPVDRVLQIGSPKGVARLLQRAGRSGHRPGAASRVTCVPTHALELIEVAAARDGVGAGRDRVAPSGRAAARRSGAARRHRRAGRRIRADEQLLREVRTTRAYAELRDDEWRWVLDFLTNGGDALRAYPEYSRIVARGRTLSSSRTTRSRAGIGCRSARSSATRRSASRTCAAHRSAPSRNRSSRDSSRATDSCSPARRSSSCACAT